MKKGKSKHNPIEEKSEKFLFAFIYSLGILYGGKLLLNIFKIFINFPNEISKEITFLVLWGGVFLLNYILLNSSFKTSRWFKKDVYIITGFLFILTIILYLIKFV